MVPVAHSKRLGLDESRRHVTTSSTIATVSAPMIRRGTRLEIAGFRLHSGYGTAPIEQTSGAPLTAPSLPV